MEYISRIRDQPSTTCRRTLHHKSLYMIPHIPPLPPTIGRSNPKTRIPPSPSTLLLVTSWATSSLLGRLSAISSVVSASFWVPSKQPAQTASWPHSPEKVSYPRTGPSFPREHRPIGLRTTHPITLLSQQAAGIGPRRGALMSETPWHFGVQLSFNVIIDKVICALLHLSLAG